MSNEADKSQGEHLTKNPEALREFLSSLPANNRGHCRIELCGGIGVGKTTAGVALARAWSLPLFCEAYEMVPYWEKYYRDPDQYELEKNVSFLLSYSEIIRTAVKTQLGHMPQIYDFSLLQILAYCDLSRSRADANAVEQLHSRIADRFGPPSLLIHLSCPIEDQMRHIEIRGRELEANIDPGFLVALNDRIGARVAELDNAIFVLEIDTHTADFKVHPDREALRLAHRLMFPRGRASY